MPELEIHYDDGGEWAALYIDGELYSNVGDAYVAEEKALELCGVKTVHGPEGSDWLRGGTSRAGVALTLDEVEAYRSHRRAREAEAAAKRAEAERLLAEADALLAPPGATP